MPAPGGVLMVAPLGSLRLAEVNEKIWFSEFSDTVPEVEVGASIEIVKVVAVGLISGVKVVTALRFVMISPFAVFAASVFGALFPLSGTPAVLCSGAAPLDDGISTPLPAEVDKSCVDAARAIYFNGE